MNRARLHKCGFPVTVLPEDSSNGCQLSERTCALCGLVRITVHPPEGFAYRAWRTPSGYALVSDHTPACEPLKVAST